MKKRFLLVILSTILTLGSTTVNAATLDRLGGLNRYETAEKINNNIYSKTLILVSGHDFADALVAAPLVYHLDGEIHLTQNNKLSQNTIDSLNRNEFNRAVIVGGYSVVNKDVENELKGRLSSVTRYAGDNRYLTSRKVAKAIVTNEGTNNYRKYPYAFIVSGNDFPDALSIASVSAMTGSPILLNNGQIAGDDLIAIATATEKVYKIGGQSVVGNEMDKNITTDYKRLGGTDRYETNKLVVEEFSNLFNKHNAYIASGLDYPDALTGSALAGKNKQAIILSKNPVSEHSKNAIKIINPTKITALGGVSAVSESTLNILSNNNSTETIDNNKFIEQINKEVFRLVNVERKKANLPALEWNDQVLKYSTEKSKDMAKNNYFDHSDLNGKFTYDYMFQDGISFNYWAENIITARNSENVTSIAQDMVTRWMNSPGHRQNILNSEVNSSAIGVFVSDKIIYGTQIFIRKY